MSDLSKRCTVYLEPDVHRALRIMAAETGRSISDYVNEAVSVQVAEDAEDLALVDERQAGETIGYESYLKELNRLGGL